MLKLKEWHRKQVEEKEKQKGGGDKNVIGLAPADLAPPLFFLLGWQVKRFGHLPPTGKPQSRRISQVFGTKLSGQFEFFFVVVSAWKLRWLSPDGSRDELSETLTGPSQQVELMRGKRGGGRRGRNLIVFFRRQLTRSRAESRPVKRLDKSHLALSRTLVSGKEGHKIPRRAAGSSGIRVRPLWNRRRPVGDDHRWRRTVGPLDDRSPFSGWRMAGQLLFLFSFSTRKRTSFVGWQSKALGF